jgi:hypothetical protein
MSLYVPLSKGTLPWPAALERLCIDVRHRARQEVYHRLTDGLSAKQRKRLDALPQRREDQWDWIKDTLPGRAGSVGVTAADNRRFVDAVLYRYRTGIPWRDLPEALGSNASAPSQRVMIRPPEISRAAFQTAAVLCWLN